jgi:hypothetical protein
MTHSLIPLIESIDEFGWDPQEVYDLIQTTPLLYDADGLPVGYDAEQLFGLEGDELAGRFL